MSCCGPSKQAAGGCRPLDSTQASVQEYYGKTLGTSKDLVTSACTTSGRPKGRLRQLLAAVPEEVMSKFYGCGSPLPLGIEGLRVLDLGSGSGRDCYVCSALVGVKGSVTGLDMTDEQLEVARAHVESYTQSLGYAQPNMRFVRGLIEYLDEAGLPDSSADLVVSNCVVNLSPDKARVLREVYRVLAAGGEFHFSDVYCDRRLPGHVRKHEVLWGECIAGALYVQDFLHEARAAGFVDARVLSVSPVSVDDPKLLRVVGDANFYSISYRLFKLPGLLEESQEDYGQQATYQGSIADQEQVYTFDRQLSFKAGQPQAVSGNTAAILQSSWLARHFKVTGDRTVHHGSAAPETLGTASPPRN